MYYHVFVYVIYRVLVYRPGYFTVHPPPAPSGPKFSNSEKLLRIRKCDATKNLLGYGGSQRPFLVKKRVFFQKTYFGKNS